MDDLHQPPEGHDDVAREHDAPREGPERDLIDEPVLPLLGLSATTLAAVFVGGAFGTVARYLLDDAGGRDLGEWLPFPAAGSPNAPSAEEP